MIWTTAGQTVDNWNSWYFSDTVCWQVRFLVFFFFPWIWFFIDVDGELSHPDLKREKEWQCLKILKWLLNKCCYFYTWWCGRPTSTNTLTLNPIIPISPDRHTHTHTLPLNSGLKHTLTFIFAPRLWTESNEGLTPSFRGTVNCEVVGYCPSELWLYNLVVFAELNCWARVDQREASI